MNTITLPHLKSPKPNFIKVIMLAILTFSSIASIAQRTNTIETIVSPQPSNLVNIRILHDKYRLIAGQQFTTKITNVTNQPVKVTGSLVAVLVCGNEKVSNFEIVINPGKTEGGRAYLDDFYHMTGLVEDKDCTSPQKIITNPDKPHLYQQNRIKSVYLRNLTVKIEKEEDPNANNDAAQANNSVNSSANNRSNTTQNNRSNPQQNNNTDNNQQNRSSSTATTDAANKALQAQTQQYLNQANDTNTTAITRARLLSQAQINATRSGGATAEQKKAIKSAKSNDREESTSSIASSTVNFAKSMKDVKVNRASTYDADDLNAGIFFLGLTGEYPLNKASSFKKFGFGPTLLSNATFGDFLATLDASVIFNQPSSISTIASLVNLPESNLTNPATGADAKVNVSFGYCIIRQPGAILALQPAAGLFYPGKFVVTNNGTTVSSDDSFIVNDNLTFANDSFIFSYGGYLRFFSDDFSFSLGYMTNSTKTYNLSNNGENQIKANFNPGMLSFSFTYRLL